VYDADVLPALHLAFRLQVGPEGPIIHLGAAMGAGISQGRSKTLGCTTSIFERFRNTQDKREFITCGAAVVSPNMGGLRARFGDMTASCNVLAMLTGHGCRIQRSTWRVTVCNGRGI